MKFNYDKGFNGFMNKAGDIIILNLLFILTGIGIVTVGASYSALYYCLLKRDADEGGSVVAMYFDSFRKNLKQGIYLTLLCAIPLAFLAFEVWVYFNGGQTNTPAVICFFISLIVFMGTASYAFPLQSRFTNTVAGTVKNAFLLSLSYFPRTMAIIILNLILPALLLVPQAFVATLTFWFFFGFALIAELNVKLLSKVFRRLYEQL